MDEDTLELIARLCTRAGTRMEDASVVALTIGRPTEREIAAALDQLSVATEEIRALIGAARRLCQ